MNNSQQAGGMIYELMPKIMADIPVITKDRKNQGQGYQFRGIDDAYNMIHPVLVKHGVFVPMEVVGEPVVTAVMSKSGGSMTNIVLRLRAHFTAQDGSSVTSEAVGQGLDQGDKAAAKAQSMAIKQIFFETFAIPTDDPKDAENDDPDPAYAAPKPPKPATAPAAALITEDQAIALKKLLADKQEEGKDTADLIERVKAKLGIDKFPNDLTKEQAAKLIKAWSGK